VSRSSHPAPRRPTPRPNWSLIENGPLVELAPAYDLLNTRILIDDDDESALTLDGRKRGFDRRLLLDYFGKDVCGMNERMMARTLDPLKAVDWQAHVRGSRLAVDASEKFGTLVRQRLDRLLRQ